MQSTKALIHLDNLRRNIETARKKIGPHPKICLPVKADGYGHGAVPVSLCALKAGVEYLAVAGVSEGAELRSAKIEAPILLLSQAQPEELPGIIFLGLTPLVSDNDFIEEASRAAEHAGKKLTLHLKIDSGMGRLGCRPEEAAAMAANISSRKYLRLGGVATHLSVSDSPAPEDAVYTRGQLRRFAEAVEAIKKAGIEPGIVHAANSGALVFHEDSYFDMIRPGLFLYGYPPAAVPPPGESSCPAGRASGSGVPSASQAAELSVEPVMELRSKVVFIKRVKKGEAVSYGGIWTAPYDTNIGVIPAGYADGLPWGLFNNHSVQIRGKAYPLAGRICMDQCMIDLGPETEVRRWDEAVIFGPGFISAADMARKLSTIPYEIICNINKRVPREYVE